MSASFIKDKDDGSIFKMNTDKLDGFFLEGGDELMNSQPCPKRKEPIYLNQDIEWVDR